MTRTRFGLHLTDFSHPAWAGNQLLPRLTTVCQALEDSEAFDTLWLPDHLTSARRGRARHGPRR